MGKINFHKHSVNYRRVNNMSLANCGALIENIKVFYFRTKRKLSLKDQQRLLTMLLRIEQAKKYLPDEERQEMYDNLKKIKARYAGLNER